MVFDRAVASLRAGTLALIFSCANGFALPDVGRADTDAATRFLERRVHEDPDDFIAWNKLADRHLQRFRTTFDDELLRRARTCAEKSLSAFSADQNPEGLAIKARVQLALHEFDAARQSALRLQEIAPRKSYPFRILGDALLELGAYDEARRAY